MNWTAYVDNYCERVDPSFWAEPLNAVTNAAFILAAAIALVAAIRAGRLEGLTIALIAIATAVGVGSFLFHTYATRWAGVADTTPILLFILTYLYAATRRYVGAPVWAALAAPVLFIPFSAAFVAGWSVVLPSLNGSQGYFPVIIALVAYGLFLTRRGHPAAKGLFAGAGIFAASLFFRSIDQSACAAIPVGTHFLWHVLNGALLGTVMMTFIRHGAAVPAARLAPAMARG